MSSETHYEFDELSVASFTDCAGRYAATLFRCDRCGALHPLGHCLGCDMAGRVFADVAEFAISRGISADAVEVLSMAEAISAELRHEQQQTWRKGQENAAADDARAYRDPNGEHRLTARQLGVGTYR